jgi:hypothetical protein
MNLSVGAGHAREIKRRVDLKIWPFPVGAGHAREWKGGIVFPPRNDSFVQWAVPTLHSHNDGFFLWAVPTLHPRNDVKFIPGW